VAVAGGSKVCMSKKLIANNPSPNPLFFNNGLIKNRKIKIARKLNSFIFSYYNIYIIVYEIKTKK
jgi:hypothetical protein